MEEVLDEVRLLVAQGVKEFQVIAQELTYYGIDLYKKQMLPELIEKMAAIPGVKWIRLHYAYPAHFPKELFRVMRENKNVCKYMDIALQHISDNMLQRMNRHVTKAETYELIEQFRKEVPGIHLRTTLMVGFPGETEQEFQDTLDAIDELELDYSNTAAYSPREFTKAGKMIDKFLPDDVKYERLERLNEKNKQACLRSNEKFIGKILKVLVEDKTEKNGVITLNSRADNNKIVHFVDNSLNIGDFTYVKITKAQTWCLYGEPVV